MNNTKYKREIEDVEAVEDLTAMRNELSKVRKKISECNSRISHTKNPYTEMKIVEELELLEIKRDDLEERIENEKDRRRNI